jgi:hypothetical protein
VESDTKKSTAKKSTTNKKSVETKTNYKLVADGNYTQAEIAFVRNNYAKVSNSTTQDKLLK